MSELFTLFGGDAPVDSDVSRLLSSPDRRSRMAAYAYMYANPDCRRIDELVDAVIAEGTRFGQYWGLRALGQQTDPSALDAATRGRLEQFAATLEPDTDAADELRQLLGRSPA